MSDAFDPDGPLALPRSNGELVFSAPWESRVFGLAVALRDQGLIDWEEFRRELILQIAGWERDHPDHDAEFLYYRHWQRALETVLERCGLCSAVELGERSRQLASRPHGHDHPGPPAPA